VNIYDPSQYLIVKEIDAFPERAGGRKRTTSITQIMLMQDQRNGPYLVLGRL
jgi:hypothetical protein